MVADRLERLRSIPLFADLSRAALEQVARAAHEVEIPAGRVIIEPRTKGSGMFVIEDGTVGVETRSRKTDLGPGDFVGELALLNSSSERTARVRAKTDVRCLAIDRHDFEDLLEANPKIAITMLATLAERLDRATS
ncbi:MAG: cyclic nucleotide-binding domain-containing protein [Actinomycetota bacterium]|nr:cyclic nucleotide-binding domain-containing protein [Actinomycetota bacterium]